MRFHLLQIAHHFLVLPSITLVWLSPAFYQLIGAIRISLVVGALASTTIAVGIIIAIITTILATFASFSSLFI